MTAPAQPQRRHPADRAPRPQAPDEFADDFASVLEATTADRSTIGCVIAACNEADSIGGAVRSLLEQSRVPDVIHVVVNNTSDATVAIASQFAGPHEVATELGAQFTEVFVHDIGDNPDRKVGALNYGYSLVEGYDYLLGVDADTRADRRAVEFLEGEAVSDSRIGGISAICAVDDHPTAGAVAKWLVAGQRSQVAASTMQHLLRGRNAAVVGGQFSIFSTTALRDAMTANHQSVPWVKDCDVENAVLSLQIKSAGYLTKISPFARAAVRGRTTLAGYDAQQTTWTYSAIELMWPGERGDTRGQPLHPNLRVRWFEQLSMLTHLFVRLAFVALVIASLSVDAFEFSPWWLIPLAVTTLVNLRVVRSMATARARDYAFALLVLPAEAFMWIRIRDFVRSWARFFSKAKVDAWARQVGVGGADRGSGRVTALLLFSAAVAGTVVVWGRLDPATQSTVLAACWPIVAGVIGLQTVVMACALFRRHHGYRV
ncbi:glycosyltransferase [Microbacterium sp. 179-B 1A2 NHS]|uniref:glycosyltransferase family 2 protein n=1 Tax=Microbacterium sp. 179-B 1A2 NHS TaxID=3142383 RepID=UPI0039A2D441